MTEDETVGWHHRLNGREFEWTLGVGMDREDWHAAIHGVAKSWTRLSDWTAWLTESTAPTTTGVNSLPFAHTAPGSPIWFWAHLRLCVAFECPFPAETQRAESSVLLGLTYSVGLFGSPESSASLQKVVPCADVFLMYLWGRRWSVHLTSPPVALTYIHYCV